MKRSKQVISLLFALALLGSFAIVAPVAAAEEETPQWVSKAPMKEVRTDFCAQAVDGKIYLFGGKSNMNISMDSVGIYDPTTNSWTSGTRIPDKISCMTTAVLNEKIYLIGGVDANNKQKNTVLIYDPKTDNWETGTPMSIARSYPKAVTMGGKLYVMGGYGPSGESNSMEIYDPETNVWTPGTPLPKKLVGFGAVALRDKIYVIYGSMTFIYKDATKTWELGPSRPDAEGTGPTKLVGNQIYVLSGESLLNVNILDPVSHQWSAGPNMKQARGYHDAAVIDQTIYVMGGNSNGNLINYMESLTVPASPTDPDPDPDPTPQNPKLAVLLNPGEEVQLSVSDNLSDNAGLTWTSSGAGVATVDANGKVTAIGPGLCEITAKNADGSFNQSIPVRVLPGTADLFRLAVHLTPSQTKRLSMLNDQEGVTWKSLDEAVVTVDANGQITAAGAGLAIVEATKGDTTQQMYVRVKAA